MNIGGTRLTSHFVMPNISLKATTALASIAVRHRHVEKHVAAAQTDEQTDQMFGGKQYNRRTTPYL